MSKVTIAGDVNGTGVFTIASPNGNTNRTLTLPDVTATVITDSAGILNIGAGQIYKDAIGNVGIGTSAPSAAAGTALAINGAGNQARLAFKNTSTGDTGSDGFQIGIDVAGEAFVEQRESLPLRFSTNAAERMRIDSAGRVTMPYQPAFGASGGNQGNESRGPGSYFVFGTTYVNRGGQYNTANGLYSAPVAGAYLFTSTLYLNSTGQVSFYINGSAYGGPDVDAMVYSQGSAGTGSMQMLVQLSAGDYVGVSTRPGFAATTLYMGHSSFNGHLIG
jgi:hypothetical protein